MDMHWILEDRVVTSATLYEWAEWLEKNRKERVVAMDSLPTHEVSTVFLGVDHNCLGGDPEIFETMVFDMDGDAIDTYRCTTWEQAEEQHAMALSKILLQEGL